VSAQSASWAGLAAGPAAWAVATQLHYAIVPWTCARGITHLLVPGLAVLFAAVAACGALVSWRARHRLPASAAGDDVVGHPHAFLARVAAGLAILFALVILMQGVAGLLFTGCEL
jgi:hypothetical protein